MGAAQELPVVVGVDGSLAATTALRFGTAEAVRSGSDLWLVHAVHVAVPIVPAWTMLRTEVLTAFSHELLADARSVVDDLGRGVVPIRSLTSLGPTVDVLATAAERARLVVLGRRTTSAGGPLRSGTTSVSLVPRASCPVVCVPYGWDDEQHHGRLVAALDAGAGSSTVLAHAFAAAQRRSARLEVVHCSQPGRLSGGSLDGAAPAEAARPGADDGVRESISELVDAWSRRYPEVHVTTRIEGVPVRDTLVRCTALADVTYIGHDRRASRTRYGEIVSRVATARPGQITEHLLRHARGPVEVVPVAALGRWTHATAPSGGDGDTERTSDRPDERRGPASDTARAQ